MFKLFKNDRLARAYSAIQSGDNAALLKQLQKLTPAELNQPASEDSPGLVESCLLAGNAKALNKLFEYGAKANGQCRNGETYALFALQQQNSLALLRTLLQAGNNENRRHLLLRSLEIADATQHMLHVSLLMEQGAVPDSEMFHKALTIGQRPLVHFLIHSGIPAPEDLDQHSYDPELIAFVRKCEDDLQIRSLFL